MTTEPTTPAKTGTFNYGAKIQALLASAESYEAMGTPEGRAAAEAYQAKAAMLMRDYQVAEEEALATDPGSVSPISIKVRVTFRQSDLDNWYTAVFRTICSHTGVRFALVWEGGYMATIVGYEGDLRYTEFLWTAALMMFSTRIDPHWDDTISEAENIWRFRNAGIERRVIADRAWGAGAGKSAANRSKVQRIYLKESASRGEVARATGLGHQTDVYRESYARAFHGTLEDRLRIARDAADSVRGGMVMHGRADRVDEAFYTLFPNRRPKPATETVEVYVAPTPCHKCEKADSGHCRQHPAYKWTQADERRWTRQYGSASARAGEASGQHAAEGVLIQRGHTTPNRAEGRDSRELDG